MNDVERQAAQRGAELIAQHYPDFDKTEKTLAVRDLGAQWEVTYDLPDDMLGGAPAVVLDKATLALVRRFRTQ